MKNFIKISLLSITLATFAIADETPTAPRVPMKDLIKLSKMYEDFTTKEHRNFSFTSRPDEICVRNNISGDEVCIHKAALAAMLLEACEIHNAQTLEHIKTMLEQLKQRNLPELNVALKFNNPQVTIVDGEQVFDENNKPYFNARAETPNQSITAEVDSLQISPEIVRTTTTFHADRMDIRAESELNLEKQKFTDYLVHMKQS